MAQRDPIRHGDHLLIAAVALAFLLDGGVGTRAASVPGIDGPALAAVSPGKVGAVRAERGGLAQFNLQGPLGPGILHLGLRPPPGSVLVVEGDQPRDPTERAVRGDLLAMSFRLQGTGKVWVMSGPTTGPALQVLAVLEPDGIEPQDTPSSQGFPSDRVLEALSRLGGGRSLSWFSPTRLGPWLVPLRRNDVPELPGCIDHVTVSGLKTCARESLSAIWNCLAHHEMSTRAIPDALAMYLDDRVAHVAAEAAAGAGGCGRVAALRPDDASRERARAVIAAAFSDQDAAEAAGAVTLPPKGRGVAPGEQSGREAELSDLISALEDSCAGRSLLDALRHSGGTGLNTKVSLMTHEMARSVEGWTGRLPDESDGDLRDAVGALRGLPRGAGCDPIVAIMALTDEWSAREAEGTTSNGAAERFIDAFRDAEQDRGDDLNDWLPDRFPLLYRDAQRILHFLE